MRKPPFALFERLNADFHRICDEEHLPYQLIPYFISSHPGCTEQDMKSLADKVLGRLHFNLEQVQDLTPTPMTLSSVMFWTGENPYTHERIYVARSQEEKRRQKSYFFGGRRPGPDRRKPVPDKRKPEADEGKTGTDGLRSFSPAGSGQGTEVTRRNFRRSAPRRDASATRDTDRAKHSSRKKGRPK